MKKGILLLSISFSLAFAVECKDYIIKEGDTLQKIAKKEGVELQSLKSANKNLDEKKLRVGQKICIPVKAQAKQGSKAKIDYDLYTIRRGGRLEHVSRATGVPLKELERLNPELKGKWLQAGTKVKIPKQEQTAKAKEERVAYDLYTIKRGGRLEHVSRATGVPLKELERLNPELKDRWLQAGTKVKIPKQEQTAKAKEERVAYDLYTIKRGGRLEHVSRATGVPLKELERLNPELKGKWLQAGAKVKIPKQEQTAKAKEEKSVVNRREERAILKEGSPSPPPSLHLSIQPPVDGKILKVQRGIEIHTSCSAPVKAVDNGRVIYSGGDLQAYGNMVIIEHDRFISLYAYNEENLVRRGDRVSKGQVIARVGRKNNGDECVLRFEIRNKEGIPLDPTEYIRDIQ
ncbi:MAG: murein hydrolase activator EnvC family protein [Aquificaceae bacterium]